uniref:ras-related protein Rab-39B-like n=1 Tax=Monopterus albus TaxID=43700 RepID=UPI0009B45312|nr:ras-related protein Rab-39B-like [Monopterus albus]
MTVSTLSHSQDQSVTRSYYRNSVGVLLMFDLTNRASFDNIKEWHAEVCERVQPYKVLFILVGQKSDREAHGERVVSREEVNKLAGQLGVPYVEASAKTGQNVRGPFELLARQIYQALLSGEIELQEGWDGIKCIAPQTLRLQRANVAQPSTAPQSKKKCCG